MQRPLNFTNTPKLASHKGNYGWDYIKQLVLKRYKDIFLYNSARQSNKSPPFKPLIAKKKAARNLSPA